MQDFFCLICQKKYERKEMEKRIIICFIRLFHFQATGGRSAEKIREKSISFCSRNVAGGKGRGRGRRFGGIFRIKGFVSGNRRAA